MTGSPEKVAPKIVFHLFLTRENNFDFQKKKNSKNIIFGKGVFLDPLWIFFLAIFFSFFFLIFFFENFLGGAYKRRRRESSFIRKPRLGETRGG